MKDIRKDVDEANGFIEFLTDEELHRYSSECGSNENLMWVSSKKAKFDINKFNQVKLTKKNKVKGGNKVKEIIVSKKITDEKISKLEGKYLSEKYFNLINSQKDASRTRAIEIFPYFSSQLARKKDSNKADAILIASFYYETYKIED